MKPVRALGYEADSFDRTCVAWLGSKSFISLGDRWDLGKLLGMGMAGNDRLWNSKLWLRGSVAPWVHHSTKLDQNYFPTFEDSYPTPLFTTPYRRHAPVSLWLYPSLAVLKISWTRSWFVISVQHMELRSIINHLNYIFFWPTLIDSVWSKQWAIYCSRMFAIGCNLIHLNRII